MNETFTRVRSAKDLAIALTLLIIGGVTVAIPSPASVNITGFFLCAAGILLGLILRTGYRHKGHPGTYACKTLFFAKENYGSVKDALESDPAKIKELNSDAATSLKLEIYYSKKQGNAFCQISEYIPYEYRNCSELYEFSYDQIRSLLN